MQYYFFVNLISMALTNIPIEDLKQVQYKPMCGYHDVPDGQTTQTELPQTMEHGTRLVITSFMSPYFISESKQSKTTTQTKTTTTFEGEHNHQRQAQSTEFGQTPHVPSVTESSNRIRRETPVVINPESSSLSCSCEISSSLNFTIRTLDVGGLKPPKSRLIVKSFQADNDIRLDVVELLKDKSNWGLSWNQTSNIAKVRVRIKDIETPRYPYRVLLVISGPNNMTVECRSSKAPGSILEPATTTVVTPLFTEEGNITEESEVTTGKFEFSLFNIGAITLWGVGFIFLIIGLVLWKRSRSNSRKGGKGNKKTIRGQKYDMSNMKAEKLYEEIPVEDRTRSGSRTKLGTQSLTSVRKQSSPNLGGIEKRKNSSDMKTILTTNPHPNHGMTNHAPPDTDTNEYSVYEELPDFPKNRAGIPPPKPFLDRKSLMISRSQSTPIKKDSSDSMDSLDLDGPRPPLKTSISYTDERCHRIERHDNPLTKQGLRPCSLESPMLPATTTTSGNTDDDYEADCDLTVDNDHYEDISSFEKKRRQNNTTLTTAPPNYDCYNEDTMSGQALKNIANDKDELIMFDNIIYQSSSGL